MESRALKYRVAQSRIPRGLLHNLGNILGNFERLNFKTYTAQGFHQTIQRTPPRHLIKTSLVLVFLCFIARPMAGIGIHGVSSPISKI
jgi:hypothetical protein